MNTSFSPKGIPAELLEKYSDAVTWFTKVNILSSSEKIFVKDEIKALQELKDFRSLLKKSFNIYLDKKKIPNELIERINKILKDNNVFLQINQKEKVSLNFSFQKNLNNILLVLIVIECAKFLSSEEFKYIKRCHNHACSLFFLDTSKNHKRKWCSMETCGNRSKVRNFAQRQSSK